MKLACLKPSIPTLQSFSIALMPAASKEPGYRVTGRKLQERRKRHFSNKPLCVTCLERGILSAAMELDHILALSNGGTDTEANRQGLCIPCHKAKTVIDLCGG